MRLQRHSIDPNRVEIIEWLNRVPYVVASIHIEWLPEFGITEEELDREKWIDVCVCRAYRPGLGD